MHGLRSLIMVLLLGMLAGLFVQALVMGEAGAGPAARGLGPGALPGCPGDLNGDRRVDGADLAVLLATFGNDCNDIDHDGDGFSPNQGDCDDTDPTIHPLAVEVCDGRDNNCNGTIDEGPLCPSLPNATGMCLNGQCTNLCNGGWGNCDGISANGCEVNLLSDPLHCGACHFPCAILPNTIRTCSSGQCQYQCSPGYANCDGNFANGCEINTFVDRFNCGSCGFVCLPGPNVASVACANAECVIVGCLPGFYNVNGIYADGCEATSPSGF